MLATQSRNFPNGIKTTGRGIYKLTIQRKTASQTANPSVNHPAKQRVRKQTYQATQQPAKRPDNQHTWLAGQPADEQSINQRCIQPTKQKQAGQSHDQQINRAQQRRSHRPPSPPATQPTTASRETSSPATKSANQPTNQK